MAEEAVHIFLVLWIGAPEQDSCLQAFRASGHHALQAIQLVVDDHGCIGAARVVSFVAPMIRQEDLVRGQPDRHRMSGDPMLLFFLETNSPLK